MTVQLHLVPVLSVLAGVLILIYPRFLNYVIALWLIVVGLFGHNGIIQGVL